ncbi:GNAT family N-acetyltransferase [Notoacmeibacter marinus]|uniref:GNAT family N-acetyltransferase n=1 Tax=Notoacmeibacter marinus TaxID=1876515 RepID=UPI0013B0536E|nr:GNAT family N-acetyltransferase [Notoacmeibacter marinus]
MMWIRTVDPNDIPAIQALLARTWHATYDDIYGRERVAALTASWHSQPALRKRLNKPYSEFVIADDGEDILGVAFASMGDGGDDRTAFLHQLYVNPDVQGRGAGTALLIEMESAFPAAGRMRLEVEEANEKAIAFYRKQGYAQIDRTENCGVKDSGIPALIMEKTLG